MRFLMTAIAYVGSLFFVAMTAVFGVIAFAGPHSPAVSKSTETVVYLLAGGAVLVLPAVAAIAVWRRTGRSVR
jgi:hypothetical protein